MSYHTCLSVFAALTLFACSSGDVTVGSTDHALRSRADGGASDAGPGGVCSYGGKSYGAGESFSIDCNGCMCGDDGLISCTAMMCASDAGPPATCTYNGKTYAAGESFSIDCNGCMCDADGRVTCTAMMCDP